MSESVLDERGDLHEQARTADGVWQAAVLSADGLYRYQLTRVWNDAVVPMLWVMLNPSTADHLRNDPTITRCMGFSRDMGAGGLVVRNLYARRATQPAELRDLDEAARVGPHGEHWTTYGLQDEAWRPLVVCAWGAMAGLGPWAQARAARVLAGLRARGIEVHHLGLTGGGQPRHPLYLPRDRRPTAWPPAEHPGARS